MELHQLLPDFRTESLEWIESMRGSLLHLEHTPDDRVEINNMAFAIGSLKGSANLFGLEHIVELAQSMENVLARMHRRELYPDESLITLLLSCCAHMRVLIEQTSPEWRGNPPWESETMEDELLGQLGAIQY